MAADGHYRALHSTTLYPHKELFQMVENYRYLVYALLCNHQLNTHKYILASIALNTSE